MSHWTRGRVPKKLFQVFPIICLPACYTRVYPACQYHSPRRPWGRLSGKATSSSSGSVNSSAYPETNKTNHFLRNSWFGKSGRPPKIAAFTSRFLKECIVTMQRKGCRCLVTFSRWWIRRKWYYRALLVFRQAQRFRCENMPQFQSFCKLNVFLLGYQKCVWLVLNKKNTVVTGDWPSGSLFMVLCGFRFNLT